MADDEQDLAPGTGNPGEDQQNDQTNDDNATPPDGGTGTIATPDTGKDDAPKPVKGDWPENWRDIMAKDDAKLRKRLDRFKSPNDITQSFLAAEQRISTGDLKAKLPDDATDEQIAEYRKENGIPEKAGGYLDALPDGLVIGDDDKPVIEGFLERAHGKNADPAVVSDMIGWYYEQQEEAVAVQAEADKAFKQEAEDALRAEWGGEFRGNLNAMNAFLDSAGSDENGTPIKDLLLNSRAADGSKFANNPAMLKWLTKLADDANPAGFVAPGTGMSQIDSVDTEIAGIEKTMREDRNAYNKDQKMQDRYLQLLTAREKLKAA